MKVLYILTRVAIVFLFLVTINACTTDDLNPATEQNKPVEGGITSDANLYGILKGAYSRFTGSGYYGRDIIIYNEVRNGNCFSNGNSGRFTTQAGFAYSENTGFFWDDAYRVIASANIIIAVDPELLTGDQTYIKHMQGEALVMRALAHFDLLKQYGQQNVGGTLGVPYVKEFKGEDLLPSRGTITSNVTDIMADLQTAYGLMDASYDDGPEFITKMAAKAIESSVAVYFGNWTAAKAAAEIVVESEEYSIIGASSFVSSFASDAAANSIFELAFSATDNAGINGLAYIYRTTGGGSYGDVEVVPEVIDIFDAGDVRADILGYEGDMLRNIGKFPDNQGYDNVNVIRYEEVILNLAEAQLETSGDALGTLNLLAEKRGIDSYTTISKEIILSERRKELMFEGRYFDDLMRTGSDIEKVSIKQNFAATIPYGDFRLAYPIPKAELDANSNMVQNSGY